MSTGANITTGSTASATTMALPPALRPWHDWLAMFDAEQAAAIGAMLLPLQHALGPFRAPPKLGTEEPNGIDDLRRRGPYDRLLLSEWLLADEMPDEFLRRASGGEHLFLSPRRESRRLQRRIVAVFDCGALQLGASRLAHLALWILLARRAADVGATFEWGLLHAPAEFMEQREDRALKALLGARHLGRPGEADLMGWRTLWQDDPDAVAERWLIGAPGMDAAAHEAGFGHLARIERDLHSHLSVSLQTPSQSRRVRVPLPGNAMAQALLRGAFRIERMALPIHKYDAPIDPSRAPVFGARGYAIGVLLAGIERAVVHRLPKNPSRLDEKPKSSAWGKDKSLLCGAIHKHTLAGLIADASHLYPWRLDGLTPIPLKEADAPKLPTTGHWMPCLFFASGARPYHLYLIDAEGFLIEWCGAHAHREQRIKAVAGTTLGLARGDDLRLIYACRVGTEIRLELRHRNDGATHVIAAVQAPACADRVLMHGQVLHRTWVGAWAFAESPESAGTGAQWRLCQVRTDEERTVLREVIEVPLGASVVGVSRDEAAQYGLVALSANRLAVLFVQRNERRTLYSTTTPIAAASVATDCDMIAATTEDGRLIVLTPGGNGPLEWHPPASAARTGTDA